jgi:hypothetical protein
LKVSALEYWSTGANGVLEKKVVNPMAITPKLQYSNTPKSIEIESSPDELPSLGL